MKKIPIGFLVLMVVLLACSGSNLLASTVVPPTQTPYVLVVTATPVPAVVPNATAVPIEMPAQVQDSSTIVAGDWNIQFFSGATAQMQGWIPAKLDPANWPDWPNIDNPRVGFKAADGLEYGMDEHLYCQRDQTCDMIVPAMHYRIISGDYDLGFDSCKGSVGGQGCAIMLVNVGVVSSAFRNIMIDTGFNVMGRYWNGDKMPLAIWAGLSKVAHDMLNIPPQPGSMVNRGANCSVPTGCQTVREAFVILSGNEVLMKGITQVSR